MSITWSELRGRAIGLANVLRERGYAQRRALLIYPAGIDFVIGLLGCQMAEVLPAPLPPPRAPLSRTLGRLTTVAGNADAHCVLTTTETLAAWSSDLAQSAGLGQVAWIATDRIPPSDTGDAFESRPDEPAVLQYTSGSLSNPKGVVVSHRNLSGNSRAIAERWDINSDSVIISWLPNYHDMGLVFGVLQPLVSGCRSVLLSPEAFVRRPANFLHAIGRFAATHSMSPNFGFELCTRKTSPDERRMFDLSSWRAAVNGAEPVRAETIRNFEQAFESSGFSPLASNPAYGLAEATLVVSAGQVGAGATLLDVCPTQFEQGIVARPEPGQPRKTLAGCGQPLRGVDVRIVDPQSLHPCPAGRVGEIWIAGPSVATGYLGATAATRETFENPLDGANYLRTGDLGFLHEGILFVTGRLKDVIIVRGRNHYPQDIEKTVEDAHHDIRPGCVAAFSIERDGAEALGIVAEWRSDGGRAPAAEVLRAIRGAVASTHDLEIASIALVSPGSIHKTSSGKIKRAACRQSLVDGTFRPAPQHQPSEVARFILGYIERLTHSELDEAALNGPVTDLGLGSLQVAELVLELERTLGLSIPTTALQTSKSVAEFLSSVAERHDSRSAPPPTTQLRSGSLPPPPARAGQPAPPDTVDIPELSLLFFGNNTGQSQADHYQLLVDACAAADRHGFHAVWLPERHFHAFGGISPNPAVTAAALSRITERVRLRAGSVVLPLHNPIRVAEDWALVDNLSGGRVDLSFATGWNSNDFCLNPDGFATRRETTLEGIDTIRSLWRGESLTVRNGIGENVAVKIVPAPLQSELNTWFTCTGSLDSFITAGKHGFNVLTALLFQSSEEVATKISLYRQARAAAGYSPETGRVTLMLHTYVGSSEANVRDIVYAPFSKYLESSIDLWRRDMASLDELEDDKRAAVIEAAFDRYHETHALFGTEDACLATLRRAKDIGVDEVACLVDFGVAPALTLASIDRLQGARLTARTARHTPNRNPT